MDKSGHRFVVRDGWHPTPKKVEFKLRGLRNRDLRVPLFSPIKDKKLQRRQAAAITRRIALLRAHGLLRKAGATHRYHLTKSGQRIVTALLAASSESIVPVCLAVSRTRS
jgi:hypothetical protein